MDDYKLKIHNSFSSKAESYDAYAKIQKVVAERMIERLDVMNFTPKNILDLGCGTGLLTSLLNKRYNDSRIISVDFSSEMLKTCFEKDVKSSFVCADIEYLPFKSMNFDLVISNFTLHWCQNLQKILLDVQNNLTDKGIFFFSTLGPDSLNELREAFLEVDRFNHVNNFIDMHHYGDALLKIGFSDPVVDNEKIIVEYQSFSDVLKSLKKIGANTLEKIADKKLKKTDYQSALDGYGVNEKSNYPVTYEVLYGLAWKKTPSNPKINEDVIPIKPIK
mgnify:CR=1 FL=1